MAKLAGNIVKDPTELERLLHNLVSAAAVVAEARTHDQMARADKQRTDAVKELAAYVLALTK